MHLYLYYGGLRENAGKGNSNQNYWVNHASGKFLNHQATLSQLVSSERQSLHKPTWTSIEIHTESTAGN